MPTTDARVADFWIRAAARVIDQALGIVVSFISIIIATIVVAIRDPTGRPEVWLEAVRGLSLLGMATSFLGNVAYHSISEAMGAASVGKLICGLRVVSEDLSAVSFRSTLIRSAAFLVDGFLFGAVGYRAMERSALRQRLGDRWARTAVVKVRVAPRCGSRPRTGVTRATARRDGLGHGFRVWVHRTDDCGLTCAKRRRLGATG